MERQRKIKIIVSLTILAISIINTNLRRDNCVSSPPDINVTNNITLQNVIGKKVLEKAIEAMRSKGYASMTLLLETQPLVMDPRERESTFLIVAPSDKAIAVVKGKLSPVLLRHIMILKSSRKEEGFARTFLPGFVITATFMDEFEVCPDTSLMDYLYKDDMNIFHVFGLQEEIFPAFMEKDVINKRV